MECIYETSFTLRARETDFAGNWKPSAIFLAMQEAAETHATSFGLGFETMKGENFAWILSRISLIVDKYPRISDIIKLRTWPGKMRHLIFPRYFEFEDANGEIIARASTAWVVMNIKTRAMTSSVQELGIQVPENTERKASLQMPGAVKRVESEKVLNLNQAVVYSDIDINGHVNNTRYIDWLCDSMPIDMHKTRQISRMLVNYNSEVKPKTELNIELSIEGDRFSYMGYESEKNAFSISGEFCDR